MRATAVLVVASAAFLGCTADTKVGDKCDPDANRGVCGDDSECVIEADCEEPPCGRCGGVGAQCESEDQCAGLECADVTHGKRECVLDIVVGGTVVDALDNAALAGADVIALDVNGAAVSRVATSDKDGVYALKLLGVPRNSDGAAADGSFVTLRADARDYATFPSGIRQAIPVDLTQADGGDSASDPYRVENAATTIALLALPADARGRPTVAGSVDDGGGGVLVVAVGDGTGAVSAVTDSDGSFTLFNVPAGDITVSGYAANVALAPATVTVASDDVTGVVLAKDSGGGVGSVSGDVNIVNGNGNNVTSVVLVVADTFDDAIARGDVPRGLRAANVTGAFNIGGVPNGEYVVLAAFENDGLVRDPDANIAGTALVHVTVQGGNSVNAPDSFKVTGALDVFSPGADGLEVVTAAPDFVFADDSSEDRYDIVLFDAFGDVVLQESIDGQSGGAQVTFAYDGPALAPGMIYQYRATSVKTNGGGGDSAIAATEDLKGSFVFAP